MQNLFNRFVREEEGQDLVEYALLLGLIAVICIGAVTTIGTAVSGRLDTASDALNAGQ